MKIFLTILSIILINLSLAREKYDHLHSKDILFYAKSTYCEPAEISSWTCPSCKFPLTDVQVFESDKFKSLGYIGYDSSENMIIMAFRGTQNIRNWLSNANFIKSAKGLCAGCETHTGFYNVWHSVGMDMFNVFKQLKKKYGDNTKLLITGHSLGGAAANVAAAFIKKEGYTIDYLYTYGAPRVGNKAFAMNIDYTVKKVFRIVNNKDPVPHVPPKMNGFHHGPSEVWYQPKNPQQFTQYNFQDIDEDKAGSFSISMTVSVGDHLEYLGITTTCDNGIKADQLKMSELELDYPIFDFDSPYGNIDEDEQNGEYYESVEW